MHTTWTSALGVATITAAVTLAACADRSAGPAQDAATGADADVYTVDLAYQRPGGDGPAPNFSPRGTQVPLAPVDAGAGLPEGAARPAKAGVLRVGPAAAAWVPVLATADAAHPADLTRLFFDLNRNGDFADDGPAAAFEAVMSQNERTGDWWSSFNDIELRIPYDGGATEPFLVNAWIVRDGDAPPDLMRFSRRSWRSGTIEVQGVPALVAVMDSDNDAVFTDRDTWSVLAADEPDAAASVLSLTEARSTARMMFVADTANAREWPLEFRSVSPDGRSVTFAVVDRPITKAEDRAPDDTLAAERPRPRTTTPVTWRHDLDEALAAARAEGKRVLVDFETVWCMPCRTMDEWIWTDAEVAAAINAGFVGVKLDGDLEEALVERYEVAGYPTMLILDAEGEVERRAVGYQTSAQMMEVLAGTAGTTGTTGTTGTSGTRNALALAVFFLFRGPDCG
jgi:thiol-disulfide isomerase/thioredoxin